MYKITATGVEVPTNEVQTHFPNVSLPIVLSQGDLDALGLEVIPDPEPTPEELVVQLTAAKTAKNLQINDWRAAANRTSFPHAGKNIACDELSRSDIDAVAGEITLNEAFPAGFPMAWKATDNTYIGLPNLAAFKAMYSSMTLQGTVNFGHSQDLKTALASATTIEQVDAITW